MPLFDYRCVRCHTLYDVFHKTRELVEDVICPQCASVEFGKLFSPPTLRTGITAREECRCADGASQSCSDGGCSCC